MEVDEDSYFGNGLVSFGTFRLTTALFKSRLSFSGGWFTEGNFENFDANLDPVSPVGSIDACNIEVQGSLYITRPCLHGDCEENDCRHRILELTEDDRKEYLRRPPEFALCTWSAIGAEKKEPSCFAKISFGSKEIRFTEIISGREDC